MDSELWTALEQRLLDFGSWTPTETLVEWDGPGVIVVETSEGLALAALADEDEDAQLQRWVAAPVSLTEIEAIKWGKTSLRTPYLGTECLVVDVDWTTGNPVGMWRASPRDLPDAVFPARDAYVPIVATLPPFTKSRLVLDSFRTRKGIAPGALGEFLVHWQRLYGAVANEPGKPEMDEPLIEYAEAGSLRMVVGGNPQMFDVVSRAMHDAILAVRAGMSVDKRIHSRILNLLEALASNELDLLTVTSRDVFFQSSKLALETLSRDTEEYVAEESIHHEWMGHLVSFSNKNKVCLFVPATKRRALRCTVVSDGPHNYAFGATRQYRADVTEIRRGSSSQYVINQLTPTGFELVVQGPRAKRRKP